MKGLRVHLEEHERDLAYRAFGLLVDLCGERLRFGSELEEFALSLAKDRLAELRQKFAPTSADTSNGTSP